ncbi:Putative SPBc2 prophage-derived single-strand DNA-specific exonuclease yorK [uncultured Clostridium sp.]|nr:Putative SPBc2 prophage-derived single-strand DNA-specific exonuclease yorK [uncultured Clostridium sp.]
MRYKLIEGSLNDERNVEVTILRNRGIKNINRFLAPGESDTYSYSMLDNIDEAVKCAEKHIQNKDRIHILIDCDVDGYAAGSMVYRAFKKIDPNLNITYSLHTKKQHGLSKDITIPDDCKLLIIPDAGSNDVEQCRELKDKGMDIIILDHHICDIENDYAIVVNNQMCRYPNKNFCGAGIVYKFLEALDEELWEDTASGMLDMCALANISDVMDMREPETRYYVLRGLAKIRSKLFKALIDKQSYSMNGIVNITSVQFYITPVLNAMIRIGDQDEKDLLFRAFIETDEVFKYKKRGETEEVDESIYDRAARLCSNAKARQTKEVTKEVTEVERLISDKRLDENKAIFANVTGILGETLTGLVAIKIAEKYNLPTLLLRRQAPRENGELFYGGSCRNFDNSPIESLKKELLNTGLFEFVQGHDNAAGFSIARDNVQAAISCINNNWKDIDFQAIWQVDFDKNAEDIDVAFVKAIDDMKDMFGQGVKEPLVHISHIPVYKESTMIMGKNLNTWKTIYNDELAFVMFSVDRDKDQIIQEYENEEETFDSLLGYMDVVGKATLNNYKGILTPQIIVKDYEFTKA